jgi:hypothetical protein
MEIEPGGEDVLAPGRYLGAVQAGGAAAGLAFDAFEVVPLRRPVRLASRQGEVGADGLDQLGEVVRAWKFPRSAAKSFTWRRMKASSGEQ